MIISIAAEHWLRWIDRGVPVGSGGHVLDELLARALVRRTPARAIELTDEGRALLAEHDALPETRKVERPRLVSRPLPEGWAPDKPGMMRPPGHYHAALRYYCARWEWEYTARAKAMAVLALLDWLDHEAAVKAQDDP